MDKSQSIIRLLDYCSNATMKDGLRRMHLTIRDFELISKESPIIGTPVPHSGNAEEHAGFKIPNMTQAPLKESNSHVPSYGVSKNTKPVKSECSSNDSSIVPILSISPYLMQWKICGVITDKSTLREINTPKGPSKVFNFSIADKEGTEIKVSCFAEAATQLFDLVNLSESYIIKGNNKAIKTSNKRFNTTGHEYEISMRNDVEITKCEDKLPVPSQKIDLVHLSKIKSHTGEWIDVIAIIDTMDETADVSTKNGMRRRKTLNLLDRSAVLVQLTIWGEYCDEFTPDMLHKPVILKNVLVNEFNGNCGLVFSFKSKIIPSDDDEGIQSLLNWYLEERGTIQITAPQTTTNAPGFSRNLTIHAALIASSKNKDAGYFHVVGRISRFKEGLVYTACAQKDCKKKVVSQEGQFYCSKCGGDPTSSFKYCFLVSFEIYDHSGSHWLTMFDAGAENLLKKSAAEVGEILQTYGDIDGHNMVVGSLLNSIHNFNIKSRVEIYNEIETTRWSAFEAKPLDLTKYVDYLRSVITEAEDACVKFGH